MKRMGRKFLLAVFVLFAGLTVANAASKCSYAEQVELNDIAANIKATYEEAEGQLDSSLVAPSEDGNQEIAYYNYFKITLYNISEEVYVKITNDYNDEVKYLYYSDSESGVATYNWNHLDKVVNFTITIYSSNKTSCANEEYRILYLTTPRYNSFYESASCTGNESFYLCQKYITETEDIDYDKFSAELEKFDTTVQNDNKNDDVDNEDNSLVKFIKENKIPIIIGSTIIVVGGVVTTVIVIKKRRSRVI